ncbi:MAG: hypothetical protein KAS38_22100 [Anaerolineales bacterium]|nr:hypothetical protein [Anaerolineales bacterium]
MNCWKKRWVTPLRGWGGHSTITSRICAAKSTRAAINTSKRYTGLVIAAEHLPHIFRRFYRTDSSRSPEMGGSGLGLSISRAFVEAHGGRITAVSEGVGMGMGTAVRFELPLR